MALSQDGKIQAKVDQTPTLDPALLRRHADQLSDRNTWSHDALMAYQRQQLQSVLQHAVTHSAFYKNTIGPLLDRKRPLSDFPTLSKKTLMANFDHIVTDPRLNRKSVEAHLDSSDAGALILDEYLAIATGGTSGERGVFVYSRLDWLSVMANVVRFQRIMGVAPGMRSIGVGAPSPIHISNRFYAEFRASQSGVPKLDVTMPLAYIVENLNAFQPEALVSYPSFIRVLIDEQRSGRLRISPRVIRSAAETLTQDVRDLVGSTWGVAIISGYSSTEVGMMGQECVHAQGVHLADDLAIYEVADENNMPVPAGTRGAKILVTTLANKTLPLIRYELTDTVALAVEPCKCGLPYTRLASIDGRQAEILTFTTKSGAPIKVHAITLRSPLIATKGVKQFQLIAGGGGLEVLIVVAPDYDETAVAAKALQALEIELQSLGTANTKVKVRTVAQIERVGSGAKMKLVESPKNG